MVREDEFLGIYINDYLMKPGEFVMFRLVSDPANSAILMIFEGMKIFTGKDGLTAVSVYCLLPAMLLTACFSSKLLSIRSSLRVFLSSLFCMAIFVSYESHKRISADELEGWRDLALLVTLLTAFWFFGWKGRVAALLVSGYFQALSCVPDNVAETLPTTRAFHYYIALLAASGFSAYAYWQTSFWVLLSCLVTRNVANAMRLYIEAYHSLEEEMLKEGIVLSVATLLHLIFAKKEVVRKNRIKGARARQ